MKGPGRILILGAGPTGLGAANRLGELGYDDYTICEAEMHVGGLACSFKDPKGYVWDIGGHVLFSHYRYFDDLIQKVIPKNKWVYHERESWIWIKGRFTPYPFQNNIRFLPPKEAFECVCGLIDAAAARPGRKPADFQEWALRTFGEGIARHFLLPYNYKVWAYPPEQMSYHWVGERVAIPDLKRVVGNIMLKRTDASWGPNNTFQFPLHGGTGSIWEGIARRLPKGKLMRGRKASRIDLSKKLVEFEDGESEPYDVLISTIPLDVVRDISVGLDGRISKRLSGLKRSSAHVVGVGIEGKVPEKLKTKCWMYFPEDNCPFYRVTVFSNYSPNNVPRPGECWSLMAEVAESPAKPVATADITHEVLRGLRNTRLIGRHAKIDSVFHYRSEYANPTPYLGRDRAVDTALEYLKEHGVYSRGRFGAWKYEVSNMDHSVMQGVELADSLLIGGEENTLYSPSRVNSGEFKGEL